MERRCRGLLAGHQEPPVASDEGPGLGEVVDLAHGDPARAGVEFDDPVGPLPPAVAGAAENAVAFMGRHGCSPSQHAVGRFRATHFVMKLEPTGWKCSMMPPDDLLLTYYR